jgi:hypothetical protein
MYNKQKGTSAVSDHMHSHCRWLSLKEDFFQQPPQEKDCFHLPEALHIEFNPHIGLDIVKHTPINLSI